MPCTEDNTHCDERSMSKFKMVFFTLLVKNFHKNIVKMICDVENV